MQHGAQCSIEYLDFGYVLLRPSNISNASFIIFSFTFYYISAHPIPTSIHFWFVVTYIALAQLAFSLYCHD
jgi:hypothetical protein